MTSGHSPIQCPVGHLPKTAGHSLLLHPLNVGFSQCLSGETFTGHTVRNCPDTLSDQRPDRHTPSLEGCCPFGVSGIEGHSHLAFVEIK
jgi:hypothetical protein